MEIVFLGLGTNMGDREHNLAQAIYHISNQVGRVLKSSEIYVTEPWGFNADQEFYNQVIMVETELAPFSVLEHILAIEKILGRTRNGVQYSSRIIDIDILFYGDQVLDYKDLKIPHPLLHERKFVLVPLAEIASGMKHPLSGKTINQLLESCSDKGKVEKLPPHL